MADGVNRDDSDEIEIVVVRGDGSGPSLNEFLPALIVVARDDLQRRLDESGARDTYERSRWSGERHVQNCARAYSSTFEELLDALRVAGMPPFEAVKEAERWCLADIQQRYGGIAGLAVPCDFQERVRAGVEVTASEAFRRIRRQAVNHLAAEVAQSSMKHAIPNAGTAVAQYDKSQIVAKLRGARMRKRAQEGRCEGRKPFGYYEGESGALRRMQALRSESLGFDRIAARLNAEGVPTRTGKPWHGIVVNRILTAARREK